MTILYDLYHTYRDQGLVVFMGDLNARVNSIRSSTRDDCLKGFLLDCNLCAINQTQLRYGPRDTFVSYDNQSASTIDYVCIPAECTDLVTHCEVAGDACLNVSRHRPILCSFDCPGRMEAECASEKTTNWKKCSPDDVFEYQRRLINDIGLSRLVNSELGCSSIDSAYEKVCDSLYNHATSVFPKKSYRSYLKPYWTEELSISHKQLKLARAGWCKTGRPRDGTSDTFINYKRLKSRFRKLHRQQVNIYMMTLNHKLERDAETDSVVFWKSVKSRKRASNIVAGAGIYFNGKTYRDREGLTKQWGLYFEKLYSPSVSSDFDEVWEQHVTSHVSAFFESVEPENTAHVTEESVQKAIQKLPKGKAGSGDKIVYEHLIHSRHVISPILANIFTNMLRKGHIPDAMKKGVIVTLHKGGTKRKDNPNNYRAITLSSCILKLFESILLERCQQNILKHISNQQGGFQSGLGCLMTSFALRESLHYARENGSATYMCFLDGKQAFDHVWHDGLFFKLIEYGIDSTTLLALRNMYSNSRCQVKHQGLYQHTF